MENHTSVNLFIKDYFQYLESAKYSPKSIESFRDALKRFHSFLTVQGIVRLQDVTGEDIANYRLMLVDKNYSEHSISSYLRAVRSLFRFLEEQRQIFVNPASGLIIPKVPLRLRPVPSVEEIKKLLAQPDVSTLVGVRDRAILETFYASGARLTEVVRINIYHVDKKHGAIKVFGKGAKERIVPLGKIAMEWVSRYIAESRSCFVKNNPDEKALFIGKKGKRIHPLVVQRLIRHYGQKSGINCSVTPHTLRRACATHMLKNGAHPVQIQLLLGHTSMATLSSYLKVTIMDIMKMHKKGKPGK